jgi:hypothetical protein
VRIKDYVRFLTLQRVAVDSLEHWPQPCLTFPTSVPFAPAVRYAEVAVAQRLVRSLSVAGCALVLVVLRLCG